MIPPFAPDEKLIDPMMVAEWALEPRATAANADPILDVSFICLVE